MSRALCELWAELASNPSDDSVRARVRERLTELIEHVDDCEDCRAVSQSLTSPLDVFDALSDERGALSPQERRVAKAMDQALSDDEDAIDQAIEDVLLPNLPEHLATVKADYGLTNLQIFLATNAVNLLMASYASRKKGLPIRLSKSGFTLGTKLTSKREALVGEIESHTRATAKIAESLFDWQLEAAEHCSGLYLDLTVADFAKGVLTLELDAPTLAHDLVERWRRTVAQPVTEDAVLEPVLTGESVYDYLKSAYAMTTAQLKAAALLEARAKTDRQRLLVQRFEKEFNLLTREATRMKEVLGSTAPKVDRPIVKAAERVSVAVILKKMKLAQEKKTGYLRKAATSGKTHDTLTRRARKFATDQLKISKLTLRRFDASMRFKVGGD
jgi:hypothetical protein